MLGGKRKREGGTEGFASYSKVEFMVVVLFGLTRETTAKVKV